MKIRLIPFLVVLFLCCSSAIKMSVNAQTITVTEGDTFFVDVHVNVDGSVDGIGFEILYDSLSLQYTSYKDSPFQIVACTLKNRGEEGKLEGHLVVGLSQLNGSAFTTDFSAISIGFIAQPTDVVKVVQLHFQSGKGMYNDKEIESEFHDGMCNINVRNKIVVRIIPK